MKSEDISAAHNLGLSYGRYRLYLEIIQYDPKITPEQLNQMSMREIKNLLMSFENQSIKNGNRYFKQ